MTAFNVRKINTSTSAYLDILHKKSRIYTVTYASEGTLPNYGLSRTLSLMGNPQILWALCSKLSNLIIKKFFLMCKLKHFTLLH